MPALQAASTAVRLFERSGPFTGTDSFSPLGPSKLQRSSPCTLL
jgi:hypothetical protein